MASSKPTEIGSTKMFEGFNKRYKHQSSTLGCSMNFHIYFPPSTSPDQKFPVLYWLSGLTCNDENFIVKSGAQRVASTEGIALIVPDTSPRGLNVEGESDSYDFGVGAGFYLNATVEKWKNWQMYDYIVKELPKLLTDNFPQLDTSRASISGHSMGGHGALTIYLKNLDKYKSVSAFAPIVNPINCPWGQKAFTNYLGDDKTAWEEYDATCLITKFNDVGATIMIDQGDDDKFLHENQLLPNKFDEACRNVKAPLLLRMQPGYDHSYHFVATFIDDHIRHHAQALNPRRHPHTVSDEVISQSILVSNTMPSTSEEERRIEDEYLDVGSVGESEFDNGSRKGKHKYEGDTNGLSGMRRMKKSYGSSKYDALLEVWSESMIARKERDLAKIEQYKSKYVDVRSSLVEEYSIGDCMTTLEATLGVSSRSYIKALSFFPDINWRKMFLMMSENRRKEWLDSLDK